jgi:hypothetical protein
VVNIEIWQAVWWILVKYWYWLLLLLLFVMKLFRGLPISLALRYKPEGRRFDSRWCHWSFSLT